MKTHTLLEIEDLSAFFYTSRGVVKAVNNLDLKINMGETLGLVGESGCGKRVTALSIMQLIQEPPGKIAKGCILFDGKDLVRVPECPIRGIPHQ